MLRGFAIFALLFHLLAGALPAGSLVRIGSGGLSVGPRSCCDMDMGAIDVRDSRSVHCCCYTGIVVGHQDLALATPVDPQMPVGAVTTRTWPSLYVASAAAPELTFGQRVRDGPPPLGFAHRSTIVIRC